MVIEPMKLDRNSNGITGVPIKHIVFWGGVAGLFAGLSIWIWTLAFPGRSPASRQMLIARSSGSGAIATGMPGMGALSDSTPIRAAVADVEQADESPRSAGIRHVWLTRFHSREYRAALDTILEAELDDEELQRHLGDLIDVLVKPEWYVEQTFPYSFKIDSLLKEPDGRDRMIERWNLARTTVASLDPSPRKLSLLARMELAAKMLNETAVNLKLDQQRSDVPPQLQEFDEKGNPIGKPAPVADTNVRRGPLFDYDSTVAAIRKEIKADVDALTARNSIKYFSSNGWSLLRTGLLSLMGALTAGVGGLVVKMYSESIAARLPAPFWSLAIVNRFRKKPGTAGAESESGTSNVDGDAH